MMLFTSVGILIAVFRVASGIECPNVPDAKFDAAIRAAVVDRHNEFRSMLAHGTVTGKNGTLLRGGKNIYQLRWDCDLEKQAQYYANKCVFRHSPQNFRHAGENLYQLLTTGKRGSLEWNAINAVNAWWAEVHDYDPRVNPSNALNHHVLDVAGHWSQQAWGKTTTIGCGGANCTLRKWKTVIVVCHYRAQGNVLNMPMYEWGDGCSKDSDCTTYERSKCNVTTKLCMAN